MAGSHWALPGGPARVPRRPWYHGDDSDDDPRGGKVDKHTSMALDVREGRMEGRQSVKGTRQGQRHTVTHKSYS